jgi:hypothetical protein
MFIEPVTKCARPPSGGPCLITGLTFPDLHCRPDGGRPWFRLASINMTLLAEGECPNSRHLTSVRCGLDGQ